MKKNRIENVMVVLWVVLAFINIILSALCALDNHMIVSLLYFITALIDAIIAYVYKRKIIDEQE